MSRRRIVIIVFLVIIVLSWYYHVYQKYWNGLYIIVLMIFYVKIMYNKQYGFRTNHSTYMAVLDFLNLVSKVIDNDIYTLGIFMDLSKVFDTIDH